MIADRVIAYIDGFNLYYGLKAAGLCSSRWLDIPAVCESLLRPHQRLDLVRYFILSVRGDVGASQRQSLFIDALQARGGIEIDYGYFLAKTVTCDAGGARYEKNEEKKTGTHTLWRPL